MEVPCPAPNSTVALHKHPLPLLKSLFTITCPRKPKISEKCIQLVLNTKLIFFTMFEVVLCKCNFLYKIHKAKRTSSLLFLHGLHLFNLVAEIPKDGGRIQNTKTVIIPVLTTN